MKTQKSKSIQGKAATTKSPSKRNKSCASQDEGTRRGSMRNKSCTSQDEGTRSGSQRNKSYATQDENTKGALVNTTIGGSHNKCTEATSTFSRSTPVASKNKYIDTRSASVKSKIVSTQKECIETRSASIKCTLIDSQSEHSTTRSASIKGKIIDSQSEHSTTRSASTKSQTRVYRSEHTTTRSASTKSQTRSHGGESMRDKGTTIKSIICDVQTDTIKTQGRSKKRTTRGSPRKGTITKNTPIKRKHLGSESETNCTSTSNANNRAGHVPLENQEDSRTCFVTQEHPQLEEGEIIDAESSPQTRHPSGRKRRCRSYKARDSDPTTAKVPKKFINKVEIVDLRQAGYTLRDGKRGQKLMKHRSTGGGRQGAANTSSSIDTRSASTGLKTRKVGTCQPSTVSRSKAAEMKRLQVAAGDQCAATAVALEEGEILSDSDVPGIVSSSQMLPQSGSDMSISSEDSDMLPQSGSDMSISSEDSGTEESVPTTEHEDSHMFKEGKHWQGSSGVRNTTITSTAAEPQGSNLNPLAAVFIPTSAVSDLAQQSNMTGRSESSRTSTHPENQPWPTFIAQSHFTQRGSQVWPKYPTLDYLPQTRGLDSGLAHGYRTSSDPHSSCPAPDGGIFNSVSSIWSYMGCPQLWSQSVPDPFWQPPLCALPGSDLWWPTSTDMGAESRGQTSTRRIHLPPTADHSCPEIRDSSRCWQTVGQTDVQAGSMEVTVMCYNILSQELMDRHMYLYDRCQGDHLDWDHRGPALLTQIIAHSADIVCLQEVEQDHWMQDIRDTLAEHGYAGVYKKQSGDNTHGCAILFKTSRFQQLQAIPVEFMKGGILDRHNVGLILLLQPRRSVYGGSVQKICVATSHLLFNPRRGDVKLAQLMVLLAEIDKHAYLDDQSDSGQCMHSGHKYCPDSDPSNFDQPKPSQSGHCGNSPQIDQATGSPCDPELQTSATPRYCPIILCGDFNSEPFCDLYKFITTGYLKYDDCISRLLCGQEEGKWNGTDRLVDRELLPARLNICESCQYLHVLKERRSRDGASGSQPIPKVNSGQVRHCMNFKSVYTHFVGQGHQNREISTHHNSCSCTVDFIFYSQCAGSESSGHRAAEQGDSLSDVQQGDSQSDVQQGDRGTSAGCVDIDKDRETCQQPLELVSRYRLLTRHELNRFGYMPNSVFPSDHLCLIARFVLR